MEESTVQLDGICVHCGQAASTTPVIWNNLKFCCDGCNMVYQLLDSNDMLAYYSFDDNPGLSLRGNVPSSYAYLDDETISIKLLSFREGNRSRITLTLPHIHCSSCLWLLENITRLNSGIISSRVNFLAKEATFLFNHDQISLRELAELLSRIGYEPKLQLNSLQQEKIATKTDRSIYYKLGYAGFAFGNIMLLSFPEYLGFEQASFKMYIGYINILLAIPILLFSGFDYLKSAFRGIRSNHLNIDVPIAIGMVTLFARSFYEIISHTGEGYLDSFAGLVFFLLIGRWFQDYTHRALDFGRGYQSYFPIAATVWEDNRWTTRALDLLLPGDKLLIRNQELIATDGIIANGRGRIDYSFVTGESDLISKSEGDLVLAGGKQMGSSIEIIVSKKVDQSYLVQLWDEDIFKHQNASTSSKLISGISRYFTYVILLVAIIAMIGWWGIGPGKAINVFTAVLIVACPCALALAIPFTYGNILRLLAAKGFFLRNVHTVEDLQDIDTIVFDKTGTITDGKALNLHYQGRPLSEKEKVLIKSLSLHSSHPLSKALVNQFDQLHSLDVDDFQDHIGKGLEGFIGKHHVRLGSAAYIFGTQKSFKTSSVVIEVDNEFIGYFQFQHSLRANIEKTIGSLRNNYNLYLLSGDTEEEQARMAALFNQSNHLHFNQDPKDKLRFIEKLQEEGKRVMMIGDGLNDAGALKQSNVGVVIADDLNNFSPSCDGIVSANGFQFWTDILAAISKARWIIYGALILAFLYNGIGLYFAISGKLSPVIAAILMPISSITIMIYGLGMSHLLGKTIPILE